MKFCPRVKFTSAICNVPVRHAGKYSCTFSSGQGWMWQGFQAKFYVDLHLQLPKINKKYDLLLL